MDREEESLYRADKLVGYWYREALKVQVERDIQGYAAEEEGVRIIQSVARILLRRVQGVLFREGKVCLFSDPRRSLPRDDLEDQAAGIDVSEVDISYTGLYVRDLPVKMPVFCAWESLSGGGS